MPNRLEFMYFYPGAAFDKFAFLPVRQMPQESQDFCRSLFEGFVPVIAENFGSYPGDASVGELAMAMAYGATLQRDRGVAAPAWHHGRLQPAEGGLIWR